MQSGTETMDNSTVQPEVVGNSDIPSLDLCNGSNPQLEEELKKVLIERDNYHKQLKAVEAELAALQANPTNTSDANNKLQEENERLRDTLRKATDLLREKINVCVTQEKKNSALLHQIASLKDVLSVTRDLLNIRNMEVTQLQKDVESMESKIEDERRRQAAIIAQMEHASKINNELKTEYETQLNIFQNLKKRYEEKVQFLARMVNEKQRTHSEGSEEFEDAPEQVDS